MTVRKNRRTSIHVRCSVCDQLHRAIYSRDVATAVGPVPMFTNVCSVTGMTSEYLEDEAVQVP